MPSPDVVVVGDINVDILAPLDHYPPPGGHALTDEVHIESGGSAANTAVELSRLGLKVAMLGCAGDDPLADQALQGMRAAGVDLSRVSRPRGTAKGSAATGLFFVAVTPDGQRTMFGGRGANASLSPGDIDLGVIETSRWLHLSGYPLMAPPGREALGTAARAARRAGIPVSLDVGIGPATREWRAAVTELAASVDVLLPNEMEARSLVAESDPARMARRLHTYDVQMLAIKLGADGCYVSTGSEAWALPAFDIEPVDSTGAGDAFDAAFIAGQLTGLDVRASALLANAVGGLVTQVRGAGNALPGPAEMLEFLEAHRRDDRWVEWAGEFDTICAWLQRC